MHCIIKQRLTWQGTIQTMCECCSHSHVVKTKQVNSFGKKLQEKRREKYDVIVEQVRESWRHPMTWRHTVLELAPETDVAMDVQAKRRQNSSEWNILKLETCK